MASSHSRYWLQPSMTTLWKAYCSCFPRASFYDLYLSRIEAVLRAPTKTVEFDNTFQFHCIYFKHLTTGRVALQQKCCFSRGPPYKKMYLIKVTIYLKLLLKNLFTTYNPSSRQQRGMLVLGRASDVNKAAPLPIFV